MEYATKKQLLTIALHEDCSLDLKYQAVHELEIRKWNDDMLHQLIKLWGSGKSIFEISIEMEIPEYTVRKKLVEYGLYESGVRK